MASLPVIDLSNPDRQATAKQLTQAMETVGFVYLDNVPGYNKEVEGKLHKAAEWFFSKPLEEKITVSSKNWNKDSSGVYRGYVPINLEEGHLREQYEMGEVLPEDDPDRNSGNPLYEPTAWPKEDDPSVPYRKLMMSHYHAMIDAGMEFLRLTAIGLGQSEHIFDDRFLPKSVSSLRIMHYPTYKGLDSATGTPNNSTTTTSHDLEFTCEEHTDTAFVTLLVTFSYPGLEILQEDGQWMSVAPRPGSLVVNIGDLLSRLTGGRFKSTYHRVRDTGIERYSVPFFFEPRFDGKFEFPDDSSSIHYGPWVLQRMKRHKYQYAHVPDFPLKPECTLNKECVPDWKITLVHRCIP